MFVFSATGQIQYGHELCFVFSTVDSGWVNQETIRMPLELGEDKVRNKKTARMIGLRVCVSVDVWCTEELLPTRR